MAKLNTDLYGVPQLPPNTVEQYEKYQERGPGTSSTVVTVETSSSWPLQFTLKLG